MSRQSVDNVKQNSGSSPAEIFDSLHTIMHLIRAGQYDVLRDCPYELTHMEGKILGFFSRNPGATLSDLASETGRDKGQLARLIKTLRSHQLLEADDKQKDRRSVSLQLTAEGRKVHTTLRKELRHITDAAVRGFSEVELATLARLLNQARNNLETR